LALTSSYKAKIHKVLLGSNLCTHHG